MVRVSDARQLQTLPLRKLAPLPAELQVRKKPYDPEQFEQLKRSIKAYGILSPLHVYNPPGDGEKSYFIINGEHRFKAAHELQWDQDHKIPVIIHDPRSLTTGSIIAVQRQLNDLVVRFEEVDRLWAVKRLAEAGGVQNDLDGDYQPDDPTPKPMTQSDIASSLGVSRMWVNQRIQILALPAEILEAVWDGSLAFSQARILAKYRENTKILEFLWHEVQAHGTGAKDLEILGRKAETVGLTKAKQARPQRTRIGKLSSLRIEPRNVSTRIEVTAHKNDDPAELLKAVQSALEHAYK